MPLKANWGIYDGELASNVINGTEKRDDVNLIQMVQQPQAQDNIKRAVI
jgi:hypothetical protein